MLDLLDSPVALIALIWSIPVSVMLLFFLGLARASRGEEGVRRDDPSGGGCHLRSVPCEPIDLDEPAELGPDRPMYTIASTPPGRVRVRAFREEFCPVLSRRQN